MSEFYTPVLTLGGKLTSMHREKPKGIFHIFRINWRGALLRALGA